jgi:hypothetical protein
MFTHQVSHLVVAQAEGRSSAALVVPVLRQGLLQQLQLDPAHAFTEAGCRHDRLLVEFLGRQLRC